MAAGTIFRHGGGMFDPVEKLKEFIRHPSVSADPQFRDGMKGAQEFVSALLGSLGFKVEVVKTALHPIILASRGDNPAWPHVIIYGHYDVQPADPLNLWTTPAFEPTIRGNRIYGRGAADNKGPLMTQHHGGRASCWRRIRRCRCGSRFSSRARRRWAARVSRSFSRRTRTG